MDLNLVIAFGSLVLVVAILLVAVITLMIKNSRYKRELSRMSKNAVQSVTPHVQSAVPHVQSDRTVPIAFNPTPQAAIPANDRTVPLNQVRIPRLSEEAAASDETQLLVQPDQNGQNRQPKARIRFVRNEKTEVFDIRDDIVIIGRDPKVSDLAVEEDNFIGREHAVILYRNNSFHIVDLNSKNGTFIDGENVTGIKTLGGTARLKLGKTEFDFFVC